jgi:transaldolase/glucose-6-phosphate isomerase
VGIVPVAGDALGDPGVYGDDRVFVHLTSGNDAAWDDPTNAALERLAAAGHPVLELDLGSGPGALGAEFFRWEFATAIAGAVLGINPFDEPNVTESKENTGKVLEMFDETASVPAPEVLAAEGPLSIAGDAPLRLTSTRDDDLRTELRRHLARCRANGYYGIQAYFAMSPERDAALAGIAQLIRDRTARTVTVGYGPRFLHSTGQVYKGGPNSGVFLQITCDDAVDLPIPGQRYTFGVVKAAQARGDFQVLAERGRRALRVHLGTDVDSGLRTLAADMAQALG